MTIPGIGRYTAGAIASIAFDQRAPIVDGNVAPRRGALFASKPLGTPTVRGDARRRSWRSVGSPRI